MYTILFSRVLIFYKLIILINTSPGKLSEFFEKKIFSVTYLQECVNHVNFYRNDVNNLT